MHSKQLYQRSLIRLSHAFQVEDLTEICVGAVGDVDEVGLDEAFWGIDPDLEGFEKGVEAGEGDRDTFAKGSVGWGGAGDGGREGEKGGEVFG